MDKTISSLIFSINHYKKSTLDITNNTIFLAYITFEVHCCQGVVLILDDYCYSAGHSCQEGYQPPASMDSDLEAFSHNSTDNSFLEHWLCSANQPIIQTNGSSRTKLDYTARSTNSSVVG